MIATCEEFANEYQIDFNPTKSKLVCFNANIDHTPHIILNGQILVPLQALPPSLIEILKENALLLLFCFNYVYAKQIVS